MGVTVLSRAVQLYVLPSANYPVLQVARSENILIALPSAVPAQVIAAGLRGDSGPQGIPGPPGPATVVGVESFNNRQNNVTLLAEDVTGALGYTPVNPSGLVIPDSPEDIGAATAAQGALAVSAVQPDVLDDALANKVDKVVGYGLSQESYTSAEKTKLAGIEEGAQVNAAVVSQAEAEAGTDTSLRSWTVQRVWQAIAAWWIASAMKTKLDSIATGATANSSDATLLARSNHTGTQAASTINDLAEVTQDMVGAMIVAGSNVTVAYDDAAGTLTISASGGGGGSSIDPESLPAAEALAAGDYVNLYLDAGTVKARKAGGSGKYPAHGFVKAAFSVAATASVYPLSITNDALTSLTASTTYFLSTSTAGAVQSTAPNSSGVLRQELGVAISATKIMHTNSLPVELA